MRTHNLRVGLVKIPVRDFRQGVDFYQNTLGLEAEHVFDEYHWASFKLGDLSLALYESEQAGGEIGFHLFVTHLASLAQRLGEVGVTIARPFGQDDDGSHSLKIADPDGNIITLVEPAL